MANGSSDSAPAIIEVNDLKKTYRSGWLSRNKVPALRGVSLQVRPGEVFGLLGPNGAGKTTLIKVLLGIVRRSGGSATVLGKPAGSVASRHRIGYLPENLRVERHHTARTALRFYGRLSNLAGAALEKRLDELIELVGLKGRDKEAIRQFSKGMNQRLGLAQALLHDPDLLILDEPTDGLDPVGRSDVRNLLRRLGDEGKSVLMNSHILQEVELVCDRVAIMTHGTLRSLGSIDDLTEVTRFGTLVIHVQADQADAAMTALTPLGEPIIDVAIGRDSVPISISVENQAETDDCIDRLRAAGVSLARLEIKRPSLEDIFLGIVRTGDAERAVATS
ncbi:ATP-binding cassette domain-containing protein [Planctomycetaceae bacterium SH139]